MNTIRNRILAILILTGIIPLIVLSLLSDSMIGAAIQRSEQEKVTKINQQLAEHIAALMASAAFDLRVLQTNPFITGPQFSEEDRQREMQRLVSASEIFSDISLYDETGFMVLSTTDNHPDTRDYTENFREALEFGRISLSRPHRNIGKRGLFLSAYLPIISPDVSGPRVIRARMSFERISDLVLEVTPGMMGKFVLIDESGNLLTSRSDEQLLEKFSPETPVPDWARSPEGIFSGQSDSSFLYSAVELSSENTMVNSPWTLIALLPMEEVEKTLARANRLLLIATAATLLFAIAVGIIVADRFARPIVALRDVATKVAEGNLSVRAPTTGSSELLALSGSFNQMVSDLREYQEGLEKLVDSRTLSLNQSQKEHEETSAHLQAALEGSNNGFLVENRSGQIIAVNQLFLDLFDLKRAQITGNSIDVVLEEILQRAKSQDDTLELRKAIQEPEKTVDKEIIFEMPNLCYLDLHSAPIRNNTGEIIGRVWTIRDNTENRHLEESLRQSQKMEAIGQLAGGVAHDFNNLLTGIIGNLSLIELDSGSEPDTRNHELLTRAIGASDRATELVKNLLGFSRRSHMDLKPCNSNGVLEEIRGLMVATVDPSIRIEVDLDDDLWGVMADPNLLSQVIFNMAVNAKDALDGRKDGLIQLSSTNRTLGKKAAPIRGGLTAGEYICLSVEDNGDGIPEEVQKRIFEPFFTTKEQGKGTGLGLATSFGIIKQLGGSVQFESVAGKGTRFDVFLPRSIVAESQPNVQKRQAAASDLKKNRDQTLLLVDDEDLVRSVGISLLEKLGYRTMVAADGQEALDIYRENESEIDLIVLDLTMPGLSGTDTLRELRDNFDYVPVLICSGYLVDLKEIEKECGCCPDGFVQKPYQIETMSETIDQILESDQDKAA